MEILRIIPNNSYISVETDKNFKDSLVDFEQDIASLRTIEAGYEKIKRKRR